MNLRERCKAFYQQQSRNAMLQQDDPIEEIVQFIIAETGRAAAGDNLGDATLPLCLYFPTVEDREGFIAAVKTAKSNMIVKRV